MTAAWALVGTAIVGFGVAFFQIKATNNHASATERAAVVDRTSLHREFCTGEVLAPRWRLAGLLRAIGQEHFGDHRCYQPTYGELQMPATLGVKVDVLLGRRSGLAEYPSTLDGRWSHYEPIRDLYVVLHYFERLKGEIAAEALDGVLLADLMGMHVVWRFVALGRIDSKSTSHKRPLEELIQWSWLPDDDVHAVHRQFFGLDLPSLHEAGVWVASGKLIPSAFSVKGHWWSFRTLRSHIGDGRHSSLTDA